MDQKITANNKTIILSNPEKIFWPKEKITKKMLLEYYQTVADYIIPYLKDRPLSLHRFPNGIKEESFYQKDTSGIALPIWAKTFSVFSNSTSKEIEYLICNNLACVLFVVNLGCIELHPWLSTYRSPDKPDYVIWDLDPEKISFKYVVETAQAIKMVLDKFNISSFCKTSGATGLHIYVPVHKKYEYEYTRQFAKKVATLVHKLLPGSTSLARRPADREKRVYIDYLQNSRGQTLAAPYSLRPLPGAPASTPLFWKEVNESLKIKDFNLFTMKDRLKDSRKAWNNLTHLHNNLSDGLNKLLS